MKQNITLKLDQEILKKGKIIAAQKQTSLSRLLSEFLIQIIEAEEFYELSKSKALNILKKGYTITEDAAGNVIKSINAIKLGDLILTRFIDGSTRSQIKSKNGAN